MAEPITPLRERQKKLEQLTVPGNFPELTFYFGSQTGTAEKFAKSLDEEATYMGVDVSTVIDFNNFKPEEFVQHKLVVVVVATHYEGDPCDNTKAFFKWFKA